MQKTSKKESVSRMISSFFKLSPLKKIVISETSTSNYNYHLREVVDGEEKYGGGAGAALCGKELGWDTRQPIGTYGLKSRIPSSYCDECRKLAESLGYQVGIKLSKKG